MTISISRLRQHSKIDKVIIHSLDMMLYQASVMLEGEEHFVTDDQGKLLRCHNILSMQVQFEGVAYERMVLSHQSAYDEMIGQPHRETNRLEVPLGEPELAIQMPAVSRQVQ